MTIGACERRSSVHRILAFTTVVMAQRISREGLLLLCLAIALCWVGPAEGESFTAITHFKRLVQKEKELAAQLQAYLRAAEQRLQEIHRFAKQVSESDQHWQLELEERLGHPTNAFRLVRRFTSGWRDVEAMLNEPLLQAKGTLEWVLLFAFNGEPPPKRNI